MKKFTTLLIALLTVGMIGISACGDSAEDGKDDAEQAVDDAMDKDAMDMDKDAMDKDAMDKDAMDKDAMDMDKDAMDKDAMGDDKKE